MNRRLSWIVLAIFLAYVVVTALRPIPSASGVDLAGFGRLPVVVNGRLQPVDSAARLGLLQIRGTVTVPGDAAGGWQRWKLTPAIDSTEWLLEVLTRPDTADARRVFAIDDDAVRAALQLPPMGTRRTYHSFKELEPRLEDMGKQVARIANTPAAARAASDREWLKLRNAIVIYERLKNSLQPNGFLQSEAGGTPIAYDFAALIASYRTDLRTAIDAAAARAQGTQQTLDGATEERVRTFVRPYAVVSRAAMLALVPPGDSARGGDRWMNVGTALVDSSRSGVLPAPVPFFANMSTAFASGRSDEFNRQLAAYDEWLSAHRLATEVRRTRTEAFSNHFQPLVRSAGVYAIVLLLGCASMIGRSRVLYRCAATLLGLAATLHVIGILFDMMLQGTLPITNWYSGVIVAGAAAVVLGGALERVYANGIALGGAAVFGLGAIVAAHSVAPGGVMALAAAVLDTPFWIATITTLIALWLTRRGPRLPRWLLTRQQARVRQAVDIASRPVRAEPRV